jgi:uncharacterized membrane protein YwaF
MQVMFVLYVIVPIVMSVMVLLAASLLWVYHDAEKRGKSGVLVAVLVLLIEWPVSLLLWLAFRPSGDRVTPAP